MLVYPEGGSAMGRVGVVLTALMIGTLAACSTTVERVSDPKELQLLGFLEGSSVSRQEIEARMGEPGATYENGRIVTYALEKRGDRFEVSSSLSSQSQYTLVVVYRTDDTLERWSLVDKRFSK